jgi:hypothetical protein
MSKNYPAAQPTPPATKTWPTGIIKPQPLPGQAPKKTGS